MFLWVMVEEVEGDLFLKIVYLFMLLFVYVLYYLLVILDNQLVVDLIMFYYILYMI